MAHRDEICTEPGLSLADVETRLGQIGQTHADRGRGCAAAGGWPPPEARPDGALPWPGTVVSGAAAAGPPGPVRVHPVVFHTNAIALPIAAGVFEPAFGLMLRPEIAALTMSGSSAIVAINAVMLWRLRLPSSNLHRPAPRTGARVVDTSTSGPTAAAATRQEYQHDHH